MMKLRIALQAALLGLALWAIPGTATAQLSQFMGSGNESTFERRETGGRPTREARETRASQENNDTEEAADWRYSSGEQIRGRQTVVEEEYSRTNYPQNPGTSGGFWGRGSWFSSSPAEVEYDDNTPIEIWLSSGRGRFGSHTFQALGGRPSQPTPTGHFRVRRKVFDYWSKKYDAPMPRSVFFTDACAIHVGSLETMSRGCIHVDWFTGELLYEASRNGKTRVIIHP